MIYASMPQCAQGFANDDARRLARARECACVRASVAVVVMVWSGSLCVIHVSPMRALSVTIVRA
jgi:hypothetical protein